MRDSDTRMVATTVQSSAERELLLGFGGVASDVPGSEVVHGSFERWVDVCPEAPAVLFGQEAVSYGELEVRANRVAWKLMEMGVRRGSLVGVCLPRSVDMVVAVLGVLKAGAGYVPLDPAYPLARLGFVVADAAVEVVVSFAEGPVFGIPVVLIDQPDVFAGVSSERPECVVTGVDAAYVIYTSGSTGRPKGAVIEHRGCVNLIAGLAETVGLGADSVSVMNAGLGFDASVQQLGVLCVGGTLVVAAQHERDDPEELVALVARSGATVLDCTPSHAGPLLDADLRSTGLRTLLVGGEQIPPALWNRLAAVPFDCWNAYGVTECTTDTLLAPVTEDSVVVGRPLVGLCVAVVDADGGLVGAGGVGELLIGGAGVARGYVGRPGLTAERFVPDAYFGSGGRLYRTGDLVRWRVGGVLEFVGRADDQVKIRGFRVELGEVEAVVGGGPGVGGCVAVARGDSPGTRRLIAYLVAATDSGVDVSQVREWVAERLPAFMVPSVFVVLDSFPLTVNGKVDRAALPAPRAARSRTVDFVPPRSRTEQLLAQVWAEVLGVDQVGVHDNFFELGGDSIQAMRFAARATRHGIGLKLRAIFEHQTLESLARSAATGTASEEEDLSFADAAELVIRPGIHFEEVELADARRRFAGAVMLALATPMQAGMLFQTQAFPKDGMYLQQLRYALPAGIDVEALRSAWQATVDTFSILRTSFTWDDRGQTLQVIWPAATVPFQLIDWTEVEQGEVDRRYAALLAGDRETGVAIEEAPLARITLIRRPGHGYEMVWTYHHALLDGWSTSIVLRTLADGYQRIRAGLPVDAAEGVPFARFIDWRARQNRDEALTEWTHYLEDFSGSRGIPVPPGATPEPVHEFFELTAEQAGELRAFARRNKVAVNLLFQAAWAVMLAERTGEQDVLFGITVAGRPPDLAGVENMVGLFMNTVPVRIRVEPDWDPVSWLHAIHDSQLRVRDHDWVAQSELNRLLGARAGAPPFESFVSIEDYPRDSGDAGLASIGAVPLRGITRNSVAIQLGVVLDGDGLLVHVVLREGEPQWARALLSRYREVLLSLPGANQVADVFTPVT